MSDDESKEKHSKRLYEDQLHIEKQLKIAKAFKIPVTARNKLNKHYVANCGNPKCHMCMNPRKSFNELTIKERSFNDTAKWDESCD